MAGTTAHNALRAAAQAAVTTLTGFIYFGFLMRSVGPVAMGGWLAWLALGMLACLADLGLREALVRRTAIAEAQHDAQALATLLDTTVIAVSVAMALALGVMLWVAPFVLPLGAARNTPAHIIWGIFAAVWVQRVADAHAAALEGRQHYAIVARNNVIGAVIGLATGFVLVPEHGIAIAAVPLIVQYATAGLGHMLALRDLTPGRGWLPRRWSWATCRASLGYGLSVQGIVATFLVIESLVKLLLAAGGALALVSYFDLASRVGRGLRALLVAGNRVLVPRLATSHAQARHDDASAREDARRELTRLYLTSFQALMLFALPAFALATAGAGVLSVLTRGVVDLHLVRVFVIVLPAWFVFCIADPVINLKMGAGRLGLVLAAHGAMLLLLPLFSLAVFAMTEPASRGLAIVAAASAAIVLPCLWLLWRHHRDAALSLTALYPGRVLAAVALAAVPAVAVAESAQSPSGLALGVVGAMVCTVAAMRLLPGWTRVRTVLRRAPPAAQESEAVLRVLVIHSSAAQYGSDNALASLLGGLGARLGKRFEAIVAVPHDGPLVERLRAQGIETLIVPLAVLHRSLSPRFWLRFAWSMLRGSRRLAAIARERRVQLVHSNTSHVLNGAAVARRAGVPHLWHVREMNLWRGRIGRVVASRVARADGVVFVSEATRSAFLATGRQPARSFVLYDGMRCENFDHGLRDSGVRAGWGFGDAHFVIGLVGRIVFWKGQRQFIEAASAVHRACPQARFVIVGAALTPADRSFEADCRARTFELGLGGVLHFAGQSRDVARVMASLDALVLATTQGEPWGLVVLEAMASSLPIVATAAGGPLEMLQAGEGLLVPPGDEAAMAEALISLVSQPAQAREMGQRARAAVTRRFGLERTLDAAEAIYRSVRGGA